MAWRGLQRYCLQRSYSGCPNSHWMLSEFRMVWTNHN
uniref:Uncharacterized protein n=1 Tax=Arundo donax TaxID=35708 RepID=A0A0A9EL39_ARUDO